MNVAECFMFESLMLLGDVSAVCCELIAFVLLEVLCIRVCVGCCLFRVVSMSAILCVPFWFVFNFADYFVLCCVVRCVAGKRIKCVVSDLVGWQILVNIVIKAALR